MCDTNIILLADSYKVSHHLQYPPNTKFLYAFFESRGGKYDKTVFFGLQYIIKKYLCGPVVTRKKINEAKEIINLHFGGNCDFFNENGWLYILEKHNGYLPLKISAVPEGTVVNTGNALFTVENTDPLCYWLTCYIETLLVQVWYPLTVATRSREMKKTILRYMTESADDLSNLDFQLHDFGFRGVSSVESAGIGGLAHLVNFKGTDNLNAIVVGRKYYNCTMAAHSIPAAEHGTIITWGKSNESDAYRHALNAFPNCTLSVVSDSYNIWNACGHIWGEELKDLVIERYHNNSNAILVIRPDSGDPAQTSLKVLEILGSKFGYSLNQKDKRVLPSYLKVIQGDGINENSLDQVLKTITDGGWSASNIVFGCGGGLAQKLDRDVHKCAFKCSYAVVEDETRDVSKSPITDVGKTSKKGLLVVERMEDGRFFTHQEGNGDVEKNCLRTVFENGELVVDYSFDEIRRLASIDPGEY